MVRRLTLEQLRLQPLRVPAGWLVEHNALFELEPGQEVVVEGLPGGDPWELWVQDLLQLHHPARDLRLDLGWVPEADPDGTFVLELIAGTAWDSPLATHTATHLREIVRHLERLLADPEHV